MNNEYIPFTHIILYSDHTIELRRMGRVYKRSLNSYSAWRLQNWMKGKTIQSSFLGYDHIRLSFDTERKG